MTLDEIAQLRARFDSLSSDAWLMAMSVVMHVDFARQFEEHARQNAIERDLLATENATLRALLGKVAQANDHEYASYLAMRGDVLCPVCGWPWEYADGVPSELCHCSEERS